MYTITVKKDKEREDGDKYDSEETLYTQKVETLDIIKVINAVNTVGGVT